MSLTDNAAALAADENAFRTGAPAPLPQVEDRTLPDFDIADPDPNGYPQIPVMLAWLRVRADVKSISKDRKYDAAGTKFMFRGIEEALNVFGPVTLRHGVNIIPFRVDASFRDAKTSKGNATRECTVTITWRIYGPIPGDYFEAQSTGESLDIGDKGSAKAQSVALRVFLINTGLIPTGDPNADMSTIERGDAQMRSPQDYLGEIVDPNTSGGRLQQISYELRQNRIDKAIVRNENGDDEQIGLMVKRIGDARFGPPRAARPAAAPEPPAMPDHTDHLPGIYDEHCPACFANAEIDRQAAS